MASFHYLVGDRIDPHLTYEDYCALPEDGRRYQLIGGDLDVTPAPSSTHQRVSRNLEFDLVLHVRRNKLGAIFDSPIDVILAPDMIVQPDIAFVARDRLSIITERGIEGAPDLVIELLSPRTRRLDRTTKMRIYAQFGVRECWLVDPDVSTVEVFQLTNGAYLLVQAASGKETVHSPLFPGLELALEPIFAQDT
jgi:Uma2 family endonuclease